MADLSFITPRLATGAALSSDGDALQVWEAGITHVIDCRGEFDDTIIFSKLPMMRVLWNGTPDDGEAKGSAWFGKSLEFALDALSRPKTKVLAHCAAGVNRGPSTAYAIMLAFGFDPVAATDIIHAKRPVTVGGIRYKLDAERAVHLLGYE